MNTRTARVAIVALLLATALALPACGNKGPLVLPDQPDESTTPTDDDTPAIVPDDDAAAADQAPADEVPSLPPEDD